MLHIDIITLFPEIIDAYARESILGRAQKNNILKITGYQLRRYSSDKKHHKVDDTPYGGGPGMVMAVQPFDEAVEKIALKKKLFSRRVPKVRVVMTAAAGKRFTQDDARRLARYDQVIFLCGRYEGVDARVETLVADESLSIGDYVLTGGELPALVMADALARMVPGVLGNEATLDEESHSTEGFLEYPQYTKPETYKGLAVPPVLLSGNHREIARWRKNQSR